ncbi:MAG: excinuclease ABC subunit UvrC [Limnochordales bacterium]
MREKLKRLPDRPGVYIFKNVAGEPIYVGKAVSLRNRVRSYFTSLHTQSAKVRVMAAQIADLDFIVTDSEVEALILEANLIKEKKPRYNVRLRDDKAYPYLKVTWNERFPRVMLARRVANDGARYFGPYTNTTAMRETVRFLRKMFPVRTCSLDLSGELNYRPCLLYHINRCGAPCAGKVSEEEYNALMEQVCLFLEGRHDQLLPDLYEQMRAAAAKLEYERAARIRDQIRSLEAVAERQKVVTTKKEDQDIIGFARQDDVVCMQIFHVRDGRLIGREHYFMEADADGDDVGIMTAFVGQHYQTATFVPREILLQAPVREPEVVEGWLRERRGGAVRLHVPKRGEKRRLVEMVLENARIVLDEQLAQLARRSEEAAKALAHLAEALNLPAEPQRIECFDISNIMGNEAVASMVVFEDGQPKPADYRRFRIRTKDTPDDYAMMREVIERRFRRGLREQDGEVEDRGFSVFPDLVVIDGGKGQLNAAREVMRELGVDDIPAIGLAEGTERRPDGSGSRPWGGTGAAVGGTEAAVGGTKAAVGGTEAAVGGTKAAVGGTEAAVGGSGAGAAAAAAGAGTDAGSGGSAGSAGSAGATAAGVGLGRDRDRMDRSYERVFVEGRQEPAPLPWASPGLKLLQRIRDEAHRYALTYHRHLRDQRTSKSVLDEIPGIGPRRKRELLRRFGSVAGIRRASVDEIASVPGISKALAQRILEHVRA